MAVSHQNKLVFIHIPKNAGTAITRKSGVKFNKQHPSHRMWFQYKKEIGDSKWNEYFKFSVVRNPWDRLVSNYSYAKMKENFWHSDKNKHPDQSLCNTLSFQDCVRLLKNEPNKFIHPGWKPQYPFVCDENKNIVIDRVFYYTELDGEEFNQIVPGLQKVNDSKRTNLYTDFYNDEMINLVSEIYSDDIRIFNFDFKI